MHATSSPKAMDLRPAILASLAAALFIAGIALGSVLDLGITSTPASAVAVPDTSYNAVEGARAQFGVAPDASYDTVESLRALSGVTVDTNSDFLMNARQKAALRAQSGVTVDTSLVGKSGYPSTRGISLHDEQRGAAGWWASAPIVTDPDPVPGDRPGRGYR